MAYKYPNGTESVDGIIADIVATTAWIDLILKLKLAHIPFPINLSRPKSENPELGLKFSNYHQNVISKLTYRQTIDTLFALIEINGDDQTRKDLKTLLIKLGEIRNNVAHSIALSLVPDDFDLKKDSVGSVIVNGQYNLYNDVFSRVRPYIENIEESMSQTDSET